MVGRKYGDEGVCVNSVKEEEGLDRVDVKEVEEALSRRQKMVNLFTKKKKKNTMIALATFELMKFNS